MHRETLVCALRGHVAPGAEVARLRPEDAGMAVDLADGRRLARCFRCDAWVAGPPPETPTAETLPPLEEIHLPRRGQELRDAMVLRLIAVDRAAHSVVFGLIALGLAALELRLGSLQAQARGLVDDISRVASTTGSNSSRSFLTRELHRVVGLRGSTVRILAITAAVYCVVEGVEAVGLWRERRWAEYLTAVATAGFLPFEVDEIAKRVTAFRVGALVVNVAILAWLVWSKRLFGLRGGADADRRSDATDPVELLRPPGRPPFPETAVAP